MNEMTLSGMLRTLGSWYAQNEAKYFIVVVEGVGPAPEIIINMKENFETKKEYYQNAYMEDLSLRVNPKIKIIGYNLVADLKEFLIGDEE